MMFSIQTEVGKHCHLCALRNN